MDAVELAVLAVIVALVGIFVGASIGEAREWERFKEAHKCKPVAHLKGDVFNTVGVGANGRPTVGVGFTADKTGWACDDGQTYFR